MSVILFDSWKQQTNGYVDDIVLQFEMTNECGWHRSQFQLTTQWDWYRSTVWNNEHKWLISFHSLKKQTDVVHIVQRFQIISICGWHRFAVWNNKHNVVDNRSTVWYQKNTDVADIFLQFEARNRCGWHRSAVWNKHNVFDNRSTV